MKNQVYKCFDKNLSVVMECFFSLCFPEMIESACGDIYTYNCISLSFSYVMVISVHYVLMQEKIIFYFTFVLAGKQGRTTARIHAIDR